MCSRLLALLLVLVAVAESPAAEPGGHRLEFSLHSGWTDFDDQIRFDDDVSVSATLLAEVLPFFSMGLELGRVGARDRIEDRVQDVLIASIRGRIEPWRDARFNGGGLLGVSFVAFENRPNIDSISEGFELGGSARWNVDPHWRVRMDLILRLQAYPSNESSDDPLGGDEQTEFVWSQVLRLGLGRGF